MEKSSGVMVEMGDHPPLKRPREVVSNQSGASSETPVAPNWVATDWVGNFIKAIRSAADSDEARSRVAKVFLFFEASLRPGVKPEIRKTLRKPGWISLSKKSNDARIRTSKALEYFKASLRTFWDSQMRRELQQASGYALSDLLGLDDSEEDEDDLVYESPPSNLSIFPEVLF